MSLCVGELAHYGREWTFYICRELGCALYYRDVRPIVTTFPDEVEVWVGPLRFYTVIGWLGTGDEGWGRVVQLGFGELCFPVDLWHKPPRLDPQISRTCSEQLFAAWNSLLQAYRFDY